MGYTTNFQGVIKITPELKASEIKFIQNMFGDMREWNPAMAKELDMTWLNFEFDKDFTGIGWDGAEKFYDADKCMEVLINETIKKYPHLSFNGILQAQGEDFDDKWQLIVKNNKVSRKEVALKGKIIECPHCEEKFELEE
jgi:hypothetical protein